MARGKSKNSSSNNSANVGFEAKLWLAADKLRSNMDAAEYKHVVLGLIFLKYISDSFEEHRAKLIAGEGDYAGANPEDPDEYRAENVFWVPPAARWTYLQNSAKQPTIGKIVDDAMVAIERDNPRLKGILPKEYARPALDKNRLGELIDLIGTIGMGDKASRSKDILGRVYEYFLGQFASAEGKKGGQFYTPQSVVRLLVEMLAPYKGRIYDPCCGSGGMFVQSEKFVEAHDGKLGDISIYGQESNATTRRLAVMNLALRGIEADFGPEHADTFRRDLHRDLRADYVLANPPFNDSDWFRKDDDVRWQWSEATWTTNGSPKGEHNQAHQFASPKRGNANFAWLQHFIHHLAPRGMAAGEKPDVVTFNSLLSKAGTYAEAKEVVTQMEAAGKKPNVVTFTSLLSKADTYAEAKEVLTQMEAAEEKPNVVTFTSLLSKTDTYAEAKEVVTQMEAAGKKPNEATFNSLLSKTDTYAAAKEVVTQMEAAGEMPNEVTFRTFFSKKSGMPYVGEILSWYYAIPFHPSDPLNALIGSLKKLNRVDEAMTIVLQHPHLSAAQRLMRDSPESAQAFFQSAKTKDSSHPTADLALGILAIETHRHDDAKVHLEEALRRAIHPLQVKTIKSKLALLG